VEVGRSLRRLLEFRPNDGVVRGCGNFARGHVDFGGMAASSHYVCRQNMVDAPAEIALECIAKEIPVGVLNDIRVELAKDVSETRSRMPTRAAFR
jgi:hypothetical protein